MYSYAQVYIDEILLDDVVYNTSKMKVKCALNEIYNILPSVYISTNVVIQQVKQFA